MAKTLVRIEARQYDSESNLEYGLQIQKCAVSRNKKGRQHPGVTPDGSYGLSISPTTTPKNYRVIVYAVTSYPDREDSGNITFPDGEVYYDAWGQLPLRDGIISNTQLQELFGSNWNGKGLQCGGSFDGGAYIEVDKLWAMMRLLRPV